MFNDYFKWCKRNIFKNINFFCKKKGLTLYGLLRILIQLLRSDYLIIIITMVDIIHNIVLFRERVLFVAVSPFLNAILQKYIFIISFTPGHTSAVFV